MKKNFLNVLIFCLLIFYRSAYSQEIEPRNYSDIPAGLNSIAFTYAYSYGSVVFDATSPLQDMNLNSHSFIITYLRSFGLFGRLARVSANVPYSLLSGNAKLNGADTSAARNGLADTRFKFGINLIGPPASDLKEFIKHQQNVIVGFSLLLSLPTGQYYNEKLINIGTHRWAFKPEIGISKKSGPFYLELYSGVWFFTKNTEYFPDNNLYQHPLFTFQGHLCYTLPSKIWIALNIANANGGETEVNGKFRNDLQKNFRIGGTFSIPFGMNHSLKFIGHTGVYYRTGQNATTFSLSYIYTWI